jgi:hypothetical protein
LRRRWHRCSIPTPRKIQGVGLLAVDATPPLAAGAGSAVPELYRTISDYLAAQQEAAQAQGLWTGGQPWEGGHPTGKGLLDAGQQAIGAIVMGTGAPDAPGIQAFHGSPHDFDAFDMAKIGTGEGNQAYGHGLYFAGNEDVARGYRDSLSGALSPSDAAAYAYAYNTASDLKRQLGDLQDLATYHSIQRGMPLDADWGELGVEYHPDVEAIFRPRMDALQTQIDAATATARDILAKPRDPGNMYAVNINADPDAFLHWDKPLSEQTQTVKDALATIPWADPYLKSDTLTGAQIAPRTAEGAQQLRDAGIPGIKYLDAGSRSAGEGTHNYVVFDDKTIDILRKYGIAAMLGGGAAATASQQPNASGAP